MEKWFVRNPKVDIRSISERLNVSMLIGRLLANRQVADPDSAGCFINPELDRLHNPRMIKDIEKGAFIVKSKIQEGKKIRVVGDFDVDGVISTFILYKALMRCGAQVDYEIPHRIFDGYGINNNIIDAANADGIVTIITCDNGISATDQIIHAKELGLTVIITDHHEVSYTLDESGCKIYKIPEADAVIDIKQEGCTYPFKLLCGAGVAFKFVQVLFEEMDIPSNEAHEYIEFAAIATVCDVVDLVGENRIFVKKGLEMLNKTQNTGLRELIRVSGIENKIISVYHLGFIIGPCINASGRLDCAKKGLRLLLSGNKEEASSLALELHELNNERKDMTAKGLESAIEVIESSGVRDDKIFILYRNDIHESIAGIIAGKVREKYNVPVIILTDGEHGVKGSGRSIEEYNMFEELMKCRDLMIRFGGHPMAAGLSMKPENISVLREQLNSLTTLTDDDLIPKVYIDMPLQIAGADMAAAEELRILEPYGKGNPKPLFADKDIGIFKAYVLGVNKNVLKLKLQTQNRKYIECVYFGDIQAFDAYIAGRFGPEELDNVYRGLPNSVRLDIVYNIDINEYQGFRSVQLVLQYFR